MPTTGAAIDNNDVEQLINKVCAKFANQVEKKLTAKIDSKIDALQKGLKESFDGILQKVSENEANIKTLESQVDSLEQLHKVNSIRINGILEHVDENTPDVVLKFLTERLQITFSIDDIDLAYRQGRFDKAKSVRPIIVKFVSNLKKVQVMTARKKLKGTNYTIFDDLTGARYKLLRESKKLLGNKSAWSTGGKVFFWSTSENKKIELTSLELLQDLAIVK